MSCGFVFKRWLTLIFQQMSIIEIVQYMCLNTSELGQGEKSPTGDLGHREISATSELGYEENSPQSEVGQKENSAKSSCHPKLKSEGL